MLTVYAYLRCSTCREALKWLTEQGIPHRIKSIRDTPPSPRELRAALAAHNGNLHKLFNTSGSDYRELGLRFRLAEMSEDEAIALLSTNGNLVKRPFVVDNDIALIGFKLAVWRAALLP